MTRPPRLRLLSLFSGYGGLDMAVARLLDAEVIAHAEYEPPTEQNPHPTQAAARVLAHRFPGIPNLGDVAAVDWSTVGHVDVICGGFPCQDVSLAGRRLGIAHDTRSGLWGHMAAAVDAHRPGLVVIENVRGLLSARAQHPAHGDVEPCPWCLGGPDDVSLRALGAVLGDLSDLGYDAAWRTVRAADVGAPHGRERVFVVAWPADTSSVAGLVEYGERLSVGGPSTEWGAAADPEGDRRVSLVAGGPQPKRAGAAGGVRTAEDPDGAAGGERRQSASGEAGCGGAWADAGGRGRAPAADTDGDGLQVVQRPEPGVGSRDDADRRRRVAAADAAGDGRHERWPEPARILGGSHAALGGVPAADAVGGGRDRWAHDPVGGPGGGAAAAGGGAGADRWGPYGPAVARWAAVLGRSAPPPTEANSRGAYRLSPRFVEWMMGLPDGWVTDVPGVGRNEALRLLGNGVVPQQAAVAVAGVLQAVADMPAPAASHGAGGAA